MAESEQIEVKTASGTLAEQSPELAGELSTVVAAIQESFANTLLNMSEEQQKTLIDSLRSLNNGVFARGASENLQDPDRVTTAVRGASALLSPEPTEVDARPIVDALRQRYSL